MKVGKIVRRVGTYKEQGCLNGKKSLFQNSYH